MKAPRALRSRRLLRTPYYEIRRVPVDFGTHRKTYYVAYHGVRVGILLLRGASVLLVRQYRFLLGGPAWEIPGGKVEKGETPLAAAAREAAEEAGVRCAGLKPLLSFMPGTDITWNPTHLFHGGVAGRVPRPSQAETDRVRWVPLKTCLAWIRRGLILDGLTVTALLAWRARGRA